MAIFRLDRRIIIPNKRPWGWEDVDAPLYKVFFNHRYSDLTGYDTALISLLEDVRAEVDYADTVPDITFEDYNILIIGAPGDDWVSSHPEGDRIQNAQCSVISFCRGVSRNTLTMGDSSSSTNVSSFTLVESHADFNTEAGGDIDCGPSMSTHQIWSLHEDTVLVYHRGSSGNAGFAYRKPQENQYYIHFGYHGIDQATDELKELLANTITYLGGL